MLSPSAHQYEELPTIADSLGCTSSALVDVRLAYGANPIKILACADPTAAPLHGLDGAIFASALPHLFRLVRIATPLILVEATFQETTLRRVLFRLYGVRKMRDDDDGADGASRLSDQSNHRIESRRIFGQF